MIANLTCVFALVVLGGSLMSIYWLLARDEILNRVPPPPRPTPPRCLARRGKSHVTDAMIDGREE